MLSRMTLGDDSHGIAEVCQHPEAASGELEAALDWLVWVGDAAETQYLRLPARRRKFLAQQLGRRDLHQDG